MRESREELSTPMQAVVGTLRRYSWAFFGMSGLISILGLTLSLFIMQVFDRVLSSRSFDTLTFLCIAAVVALVTASALDGLRNYMLGRMADWGMRQLAPLVLTGSIERRLVDSQLRTELLRELSQLRAFLAGPGVSTILDLPWMPLYLIVAFLIHPTIGLIAVGGAVILFGMALLNERMTHRDIRAAASISAASLRESDAIMRNAEVIDSLGMAPQLARRWSQGMVSELALQERVQRRSAGLISATRLIRALIQVLLYAVAAVLVLRHDLTGGAMMAGSIITSRLLAPVESVLIHWRSMLLARESYDRLRRFFAAPPLRMMQTSLPAPRGNLSVDRVTYGVPGLAAPLLRNINFDLRAGEHLAIIGPAASGKTTLSRVLMGILRPQGGVVRLDGADVAQWRREEFGQHVGYLPQDVELFSGTVGRNIARFTDADDAEIVRAARLAGCHDLILGLPLGYDTEIGDGGMLLSGGQRQQVALARALFGRPRYVVLDEPNSNLDIRGDQALKLALDRLRRSNVTVVIVTHRQSIISQMDKLLVLQQGAVRAFGPTADVLAFLRGDKQAAEPLRAPRAAPPVIVDASKLAAEGGPREAVGA